MASQASAAPVASQASLARSPPCSRIANAPPTTSQPTMLLVPAQTEPMATTWSPTPTRRVPAAEVVPTPTLRAMVAVAPEVAATETASRPSSTPR